MKIVLTILMLFFTTGCTTYSAQADMAGVTIQPMTMMVAKPLPQTLYIVMDPAKVADDIAITKSPMTLTHFRGFLGDGLKKSLAPYFQNVEIVAPGFTAPKEAHVIADVKLDGVEARQFNAGQMIYTTLLMQWNFAIRPNQETDYLFSYSGIGNSDTTYTNLTEGVQQMLKSSMAGLLQGWTEKNAYQTLKEYYDKDAAPAEMPDSNEPASTDL